MKYFPYIILALVIAFISMLIFLIFNDRRTQLVSSITLFLVVIGLCILWYIRYIRNRCNKPREDRDRLYCGKKEIVPQGYVRRGEPYECLRMGIGVGRCSAPR